MLWGGVVVGRMGDWLLAGCMSPHRLARKLRRHCPFQATFLFYISGHSQWQIAFRTLFIELF
jgi:hypothetical protein